MAGMTRRSLLTGAGGALVLAPAIVRASSLGSAPRIAVVGAGVFGSWAAEFLRRAGAKVTLVDKAGPANDRASSGGESRLTRAGYGRDAIYTRMALDSLPEWRALSKQAEVPLFHQCGVVFFTSNEDDYFRGSFAADRPDDLPILRLERTELEKRFPMIDFDGVSVGMFEPDLGALMARRAVQTLVQRGTKEGIEYHRGEVTGIMSQGEQSALALKSGDKIEADRFVFALGPWLGSAFPDFIGKRIRPTRQEVFFFAPPDSSEKWLPSRMPGWADFNDGDIFYGFPDLEGRGVKFAHDAHGEVVDPDTQSREHSEAALEEIIAYRDRRFPQLRGAKLTESRVCQYENSSNGDFLIDRHPDNANIVLVGGGSGHGFKHGPEVGRLAATLALSDGPQTEPRFTLATKSETHNREVH